MVSFNVLVKLPPSAVSSLFPLMLASHTDVLRNRRPVTSGVHGLRSHLPQAPKVCILILNIQVKECSRLN